MKNTPRMMRNIRRKHPNTTPTITAVFEDDSSGATMLVELVCVCVSGGVGVIGRGEEEERIPERVSVLLIGSVKHTK